MARVSRPARLRSVVLCLAALAGIWGYWLTTADIDVLRAGNVVLQRVGETSTGAVTRVITRSRVVALSIDDGPDPHFTPAVLAALRRHHAHATFFLVGASALVYPGLVARELRGGNEVANHTLDHAHLQRLGPRATLRQVDAGRRALIAAGAPDPRLFRAPYGEFTANAAQAAARQGELMVGWSLAVERALDGRTVPAALAWLLRRVRPGAIILAHDGRLDRSRTVAALPLLLDELARRGYRVVTVSELLQNAGDQAARRVLGSRFMRSQSGETTGRPPPVGISRYRAGDRLTGPPGSRGQRRASKTRDHERDQAAG